MLRPLPLLLVMTMSACSDPADPSGPPDSDPGTQIGGIDCEYDKLFLEIVDQAGSSVAGSATVDFPNGDQGRFDCDAAGCQYELAGPGDYTLRVDASSAGTAQRSFTLDQSTEAGQLSADCGDRPFHEITLRVPVEDGTGGGDLLTSNIGLRVYDSGGNATESTVWVTSPSEPAYARSCGRHRCWIDVLSTGLHVLDATSPSGETGAVQVMVDASHHIGVNELGDDVYEVDVDLHLKP